MSVLGTQSQKFKIPGVDIPFYPCYDGAMKDLPYFQPLFRVSEDRYDVIKDYPTPDEECYDRFQRLLGGYKREVARLFKENLQLREILGA